MMFQDDIRRLRDAEDRRKGHFRLEALIPLNRIEDWFKGRDPRKKGEMVWIYEGCDCIPADGARSVTYCEKHYNPLTRKEI